MGEVTLLKEQTALHRQKAIELEEETQKLVTVEQRPGSAHRLALSLFIRSASQSTTTKNEDTSQFLSWIASTIENRSDNTDNTTDIRSILDNLGDSHFFNYQGSLARPPCTPDVHWFVAAEPLAASVADLTELFKVLQLSSTEAGVLGRNQQVKLLGVGNELRKVLMFTTQFEVPALDVADMGMAGGIKWRYVSRYCKVFLAISVLITCTPCFFFLVNFCGVSSEDEVFGVSKHMLEHID